jgi:hypothetical protein
MSTMGLYRPNGLSLCYPKGMFHHFFVGDRMRFHGLFEEHIGTLFGKPQIANPGTRRAAGAMTFARRSYTIWPTTYCLIEAWLLPKQNINRVACYKLPIGAPASFDVLHLLACNLLHYHTCYNRASSFSSFPYVRRHDLPQCAFAGNAFAICVFFFACLRYCCCVRTEPAGLGAYHQKPKKDHKLQHSAAQALNKLQHSAAQALNLLCDLNNDWPLYAGVV